MELLGKSLQDLFVSFGKKFSLPTVLKLGIILLDILEYVHERGYIHRDIKPDSFLIGKNNISIINIIDFGFAKKYINLSTRQHIPFKYGNKFLGNLKFASISSHLGIEQSRRDDIESLGYMLLYFLKGSLPWEGFKSKNFKELYLNITEKKLNISLDNLCDKMPIIIKDFIQYSRNLKFDEAPNYQYLKDLLFNYAKNKNIILSQFNFDWVIKEQKENFEIKDFKEIDDQEFDNLSSISAIGTDVTDKNIVESLYIGNNKAFLINKILRKIGPSGLDEELLLLYNTLNKIISEQKTESDYSVYRYVDNEYVKNVFNFTPTENINYNLLQIKYQIGAIKVEKGFMSCAMTNKHIIEGNIKLQIKIPKGTHAYITQNKEESEIILPDNIQYQILNARIENKIIIIDIGILNKTKYS